MNTSQEIMKLAEGIAENVNTGLPARVVQVNDDGSVNVVAIRNDDIEDCVITVPIMRPETQRAYIYFNIKKGDRGVLRFTDKSIENYRQTGSEAYNGDDRRHSLSDGIFEIGFYPNSEKFIFPEGEFSIGLKNGKFVMTVLEDGTVTANSPHFTFNGDSTFNGNIEHNGNLVQNGNTEQTGSLHATGEISSDTDVLAAGKSGKQHVHKGNLGSPTSPPE